MSGDIKIEVCAGSLRSALTAAGAGADRIEFCDNMPEGGTTPSYGNIATLIEAVAVPVFPIIRPRGGDFLYSDAEFRAILLDIERCGKLKCDGVVIGMLTIDGEIDKLRCCVAVELARSYGLQVAFHRAFDRSCDLFRSLDTLIELGFSRVLTSGGMPTAKEGADTIRELIEKAAGRITVMPGSGITPGNFQWLAERTGAREFHGTFRSLLPSDMQFTRDCFATEDGPLPEADHEKIREIKRLAEKLK